MAQQRRYSEEQWKEIKFKITLLVIVVVVGLLVVGAGPGLEPVFLKRAIERKNEPWAAKRMLDIAKLEEMTFRRKAARRIYEDEFYWAYRGNEAANEGLQKMIEEQYETRDDIDDAERYRYFLPYKVWPHLDAGTQPPPWVGGEFAKPDKTFAEGMLRLARQMEDDHDYVNMRHLHQAILYALSDDPKIKAEIEESIKRDKTRAY